MVTKEQVVTKYLHQRWYKKVLIITGSEHDYFNQISSLKILICSGYLKSGNKKGCIFDICAWPFEHKCFNLIIIDGAFVEDKLQLKALFNQLHFCLSDDGAIIVAGTKKIRASMLVYKFFSNGFVTKNLELVDVANNNAVINLFKRFVSKNFVAFFQKDDFFKIDNLEISNLFYKPVKYKEYRGASIKTYKNYYEKK